MKDRLASLIASAALAAVVAFSASARAEELRNVAIAMAAGVVLMALGWRLQAQTPAA